MKLDYEALYRLFPRKRGKTLGLKRCATMIKTQERYAELKLAIENYRMLLDRDGTEEKYILHFSTFMSQWEDFLDEDTIQPAKVLDLSHAFGKKEA